jgi:hypothetical protein
VVNLMRDGAMADPMPHSGQWRPSTDNRIERRHNVEEKSVP